MEWQMVYSPFFAFKLHVESVIVHFLGTIQDSLKEIKYAQYMLNLKRKVPCNVTQRTF